MVTTQGVGSVTAARLYKTLNKQSAGGGWPQIELREALRNKREEQLIQEVQLARPAGDSPLQDIELGDLSQINSATERAESTMTTDDMRTESKQGRPATFEHV